MDTSQAIASSAQTTLPRQQSVRHFLVSGAVTSFLAVVVVSGLGFLESILVARILGEANFGVLALLLSFWNVASGIAAFGMPLAVAKYLSGEAATSRQATRQVLRSALLTTFIMSLGVALSSGLLAASVLASASAPVQSLVLFSFAVPLALLLTPALIFAGALQGLGDISRLNIRLAVAALFAVAAAVGLSMFFSVGGAFGAFVIGTTLPGLLCARRVLVRVRQLPEARLNRCITPANLVNFGLPYLLAQLVVLLALYAVNATIVSTGGFAALGSYAVAFALANVITFIPSALSIPLIPTLSSMSVHDPERGRELIPRAMRMVAAVTIPVTGLLIAFSDMAVSFTYGSEYANASGPLALLSVSIALLSISGIVGRQLASTGQMWLSLGINATWSATVVVCAILLIPAGGALGASGAILSGYFVTTVLSFFVGARFLKIDFARMGPFALWSAVYLAAFLLLSLSAGVLRMPLVLATTASAVVSSLYLFEPTERLAIRELFALSTLRRRAP